MSGEIQSLDKIKVKTFPISAVVTNAVLIGMIPNSVKHRDSEKSPFLIRLY
jgi:hypothetical protein